ncbi:MAG: 1-deoxy-D-xylulose-5-phosphate reductoisomerase [Bacillota bacterium]|nr:1-deoxy-D-xylulose-5-phosphate reductoisomerase [Bacillota bacterium]
MKRLLILGSTGSIGSQALDVVRRRPEEFSVAGLSCGKNLDLLRRQIEEFRPEAVCVEEQSDGASLQREFPRLQVLWGAEGLRELAAAAPCEMVLNALVGMRGLAPTLAAIEAGKDVALANKETLVTGGRLVMEAAARNGAALLPVDSEHSAIFQCLQGQEAKSLRRIFLTASGGPFRGRSLEELKDVTPARALKHPNWSMGAKITIDSATMMNKGLEMIEACWLFGVAPGQVTVVVHPESIVHSMVEFQDRSVIAQLGVPDMRLPIAYALSYPRRMENSFVEGLDPFAPGTLHFERPDFSTFRCLALAYEAMEAGGGAPVVLNAANEVLVAQFLEGRISFTDIQNTIEKVLEEYRPEGELSLEEILELDRKIRGDLEKC